MATVQSAVHLFFFLNSIAVVGSFFPSINTIPGFVLISGISENTTLFWQRLFVFNKTMKCCSWQKRNVFLKKQKNTTQRDLPPNVLRYSNICAISAGKRRMECLRTTNYVSTVLSFAVRGVVAAVVERIIARALPTFLKQKADTFTLVAISDRRWQGSEWFHTPFR